MKERLLLISDNGLNFWTELLEVLILMGVSPLQMPYREIIKMANPPDAEWFLLPARAEEVSTKALVADLSQYNRRVLILGACLDEVAEFRRLGAVGFLEKSPELIELARNIVRIMQKTTEGERAFDITRRRWEDWAEMRD